MRGRRGWQAIGERLVAGEHSGGCVRGEDRGFEDEQPRAQCRILKLAPELAATGSVMGAAWN